MGHQNDKGKSRLGAVVDGEDAAGGVWVGFPARTGVPKEAGKALRILRGGPYCPNGLVWGIVGVINVADPSPRPRPRRVRH